jgi:hypothetical protein
MNKKWISKYYIKVVWTYDAGERREISKKMLHTNMDGKKDQEKDP